MRRDKSARSISICTIFLYVAMCSYVAISSSTCEHGKFPSNFVHGCTPCPPKYYDCSNQGKDEQACLKWCQPSSFTAFVLARSTTIMLSPTSTFKGGTTQQPTKIPSQPSPSIAFVLAPSPTIIPSPTSTFKGRTTQQPTRIPSSAIPSLSKDHHVSTIMSTSSSRTTVASVTSDIGGKDFPVWIIILCVVFFLVLIIVILLIYRHKTHARKNLYKSQDIIDEMDTTSV